jgi:hypothetical protein
MFSTHHWSHDRLDASLMPALQPLTDALAGALAAGVVVEASAPLPKNTWRIALAIDNPWAPTTIDLTREAAEQVGLTEPVNELLYRPPTAEGRPLLP